MSPREWCQTIKLWLSACYLIARNVLGYFVVLDTIVKSKKMLEEIFLALKATTRNLVVFVVNYKGQKKKESLF